MTELLDEGSLRDFVEEAREHIVSLNRDLLELEDKGRSAPAELVNNAFRAIHTIKGLSGMLGLGGINALSHGMEDVLAEVRQRKLDLAGDVSQAFFDALDCLAAMVESAALGELDAGDTGTDVLARLVTAAFKRGEAGAEDDADAGAEVEATDRPDAVSSDTSASVDNPAARPTAGAPTEGQALQAIRVDVEKLDRLLTLVGELVISRSRYHHLASRAISDLGRADVASRDVIALQSELNEVESSMSRTLSELQDAVMKARLVPLGTVFGRFRRAIRDITAKGGKLARFETDGGETELDKKVIDAIGDPLMHLVRNAVDHGIEPPAERRAAGKPEEGRVTLSASQEGDKVVIEVADDGRGVDRAAVTAKAVERGLVPAEKAASISDHELLELMTAPGLSTSRKVTDVSGRGVGMDVVREALANLKGTLDHRTTPGGGTTFRIRLPLTMAIVDSLLVGVGGETYAIAVRSVKEILAIDEADVHRIGERECFRANGRVLPVVRLGTALGARMEPGAGSALTAVVVDSGGDEVGLIVGRVIGQQEIVIKALSRRFENVEDISGGSVLGDGSVCLIIDVPSLVAKAAKATGDAAELAEVVA